MSQDNIGFGSCPTVRIGSEDSPGGFCVINKEDFDENTMELFENIAPPLSSRYEAMTKDELGDKLNDRDIEFSLSAKKADLIALLVEDDNK